MILILYLHYVLGLTCYQMTALGISPDDCMDAIPMEAR